MTTTTRNDGLKEEIKARALEIYERLCGPSTHKSGGLYYFHSPSFIHGGPDNTPSFDVTEGDFLWNDRARGKGGDVLTFVAAWKSLEYKEQFPEVLRAAAELLNIPIPEPNTNGNGHAGKKKDGGKIVSYLDQEPTPLMLDAFAAHYVKGSTWEQYKKNGASCVPWTFSIGKLKIKAWAVCYPLITPNGVRNKYRSLLRFENGKPVEKGGKRLSSYGPGKGSGWYPKANVTGQGELGGTAGEDKVHALQAAGYRAVSFSSGEGGMNEADAAFLVAQGNRRFFVFMDADEAGRAGAQSAALCFIRAGAESVRIVDLGTDKPKGYDVNDLFNDLGVEGVRQYVDNARQWQPGEWYTIKGKVGDSEVFATAGGAVFISRETQKGTQEILVSEIALRHVATVSEAGGPTTMQLEGLARNRTLSFSIPSRDWLSNQEMQAAIGSAAPGIYVEGGQGLSAIRVLCSAVASAYPPRQIISYPAGLDLENSRFWARGIVIEGITRDELRNYVEGRSHCVTWRQIDPAEREQCSVGWGQRNATLSLPSSGAELAELVGNFGLSFPLLFTEKADAAALLAMTLFGPYLSDLLGSAIKPPMAGEGTTGTGKTTVAKMLNSMWGSYEIDAHLSTPLATLTVAASYRNALAAIDDERDGARLGNIISAIFEEGARQALKRNGQLREMKRPECQAFITTESLDCAGQSTANRVIRIPFPKHGSDKLRQIAKVTGELDRIKTKVSAITTAAIAFTLGKDREALKDRARDLRALAGELGTASARGQDIAARVALAAELLKEYFGLVYSRAAEWVPEPAAIIRQVCLRHVEGETHANPAVVFLDALDASVTAGATFSVIRATWTGERTLGASVYPDIRPGQVRVFAISASERFGRAAMWGIVPRETVRALHLEQPAGVIRAALIASGSMLVIDSPGEADRNTIKVRVNFANNQARETYGLWLVKREESEQ